MNQFLYCFSYNGVIYYGRIKEIDGRAAKELLLKELKEVHGIEDPPYNIGLVGITSSNFHATIKEK